jgi:septal ring factor EnvC (AmiA/AmiB activator)
MAPKINRRREVAEAAFALDNDLPVRQIANNNNRSNMLIDTAKRLQRLQSRRARVRKELKSIDADIRHAKRELKALAQVIGRGE